LKDPNAPNYIDCIGEPFNLDYLIARHGGGRYQIQATDSDAKRENNSSLLFRCNFEINDAQYPPILDFAELELEAKDNKSYVEWLQNKGIIDSKGKPLQSGQPVPASNATTLSAKEVLDILGYAHKMSTDQQAAFRSQFAPGPDSLSKSVGEILLEKMKQDDPGRDWDRMMAFMEKINKPDGSMGHILQMLQAQIANGQEQRKTDLEYTRLLLENSRHEASPRNQFGEFREIIGFARELLGTGGGRRNGWDTGLEIARDVVLPGLQTLGNTIANIMALRNGAAPVAPGQQPAPRPAPTGPFDPYRNPGAARQYASSLAQQPHPQPAPGQAPPPPPMPSPAPPPGPPTATDQEAQLLSLMQQYGGLIVNHMNNSTPGYDFADYVAGLLGTGTHAAICAYGEDALVSVMLRIPEISIFGESRIRVFVSEFVHYQEYIDAAAGEGEEEQPEPEKEPETVDMPKFFRPQQRAATSTRTGA
jgi:hypothetical protein